MAEQISHPSFTASSPAAASRTGSSIMGQPGKPSNIKMYIVVAAVTALVLLLGYQQTQIVRLTKELDAVSTDVHSGETRGKLEALDAKLQEINTRLTYFDSKLSATDQKAQSALDKIKTQEEKSDWFGNLLKTFGWKK